jgi:nucleotide-binding universal stress UspA family protein
MSFKDIAVWLEGAPEETSVANLAADLAGRLDAHAHAMTAWPDPAATLMWIGPGAAASLGPSAIASVAQAQKEGEETARKTWEQAVRKAGLKQASFSALVGAGELVLPGASSFADLVIVSRRIARNQCVLGPAFERTLMGRRSPILIASPNAPSTGQTLAIAFDGGEQAWNAARAAAAMAGAFESVIVLQNPSAIELMRQPQSDIGRFLEWLDRRGIKAEAVNVNHKGGDGLLDAAITAKASVLAAGAYGHSRAQQFMFGGTTRQLIHHDAPVSVLLSH